MKRPSFAPLLFALAFAGCAGSDAGTIGTGGDPSARDAAPDAPPPAGGADGSVGGARDGATASPPDAPQSLPPPDAASTAVPPDAARPAAQPDLAGPPACAPGTANCTGQPNAGCATRVLLDPANCGACGHACAPDAPVCENGHCTNNSVLIVYSDAGEFETSVKATVVATKAFTIVDDFDASQNTPSVALLSKYGAVLVYNDPIFADAEQLGDNLAAYWEQGGAVVEAVFSNLVLGVAGQWGEPQNGYVFIDPFGGDSGAGGHLGLYDATHPVMKDVAQIQAQSGNRALGLPINGGVAVASWDDGTAMVVVGTKNGRSIVSLNLFPAPATAMRADLITGDLGSLLRNALLYR